jgi:hypothetical protein
MDEIFGEWIRITKVHEQKQTSKCQIAEHNLVEGQGPKLDGTVGKHRSGMSPCAILRCPVQGIITCSFRVGTKY